MPIVAVMCFAPPYRSAFNPSETGRSCWTTSFPGVRRHDPPQPRVRVRRPRRRKTPASHPAVTSRRTASDTTGRFAGACGRVRQYSFGYCRVIWFHREAPSPSPRALGVTANLSRKGTSAASRVMIAAARKDDEHSTRSSCRVAK